MVNGIYCNVKIEEGDLVYIIIMLSIVMEIIVVKMEDIIYWVGGIVKLIFENMCVFGYVNFNDL